MAGRIEWHGDRLAAEIESLLRARVQEAGEFLADAVRENINTPTASQGPSLPGEFPHRDTGELHDSIQVTMEGSSCYVETTAPHGRYVEISRPFLRRTFYEQLATIRRILEGR